MVYCGKYGCCEHKFEVDGFQRCHEGSLCKFAVCAPSASTNSAMDAILALYKRWEATTPKVQHVWGVQEFIRWAQKQHQ